MNAIRTARFRLKANPEDFLPTMQAYTSTFNFVCQDGYDNNTINGVTLHHKTYHQTRELFKLPAQLAVSARMKATEALKSNKKKKRKVWNKETKQKEIHPARCPQSKLSSVRYDARSYRLHLDSQTVSILTLEGRKNVEMIFPEYYKQYLKDWSYSSADLVIDKRQKKVYLHVVFQKEIPDASPSGHVIGIDRGINNLAVTSERKFFGGKKVKVISERYFKLRQVLQKKDTRSATRHLLKLSKKERRFKADVNHQIAKEIIASLNPGDVIVLEKLTGIRERSTVRKEQRREHASWAFYQLEQFLVYKAKEKGIKVVFIDPRDTSKLCSCCGKKTKGSRDGSQFTCRNKKCGYKLNADLNAAYNIREKYLSAICGKDMATVNQPIVAEPKGSGSKPMSLDVGS